MKNDKESQELHARPETLQTGEYFREAAQFYHSAYHDLINERYIYVVVTIIGLVASFALHSAKGLLLPLSTPIPFAYNTENFEDEHPRVTKLARAGEDINVSVLRFLLSNYAIRREEYDVAWLDRNARAVRQQSEPAIFAEYQRTMDPTNPASPIVLYQRHSKRTVSVDLVRPKGTEGTEVEVIYTATVTGIRGVERSRWMANIAFRYEPIAVDEKTGKFKPVSFIVTQYQTKRLQDS